MHRSPLPETALLGRSNVGKSSLLNALGRNKKLARKSREPGRTQTLNFYNGENLTIVDLPGYGYARAPERVRRKWGALIEGYLETRENLVAGILILDVRRVPSKLDHVMHGWLMRRAIPFVLVATKSDKMKRGEIVDSVRTISEAFHTEMEKVLVFSAKTGVGREQLTGIIRSTKEL